MSTVYANYIYDSVMSKERSGLRISAWLINKH